MWMFGNKKGLTLSSFVRGVVKALTDGQQAIPHAREEHLNHHMDMDDTGIYRPKMLEVELSEGRTISVPKYSLMRVNTIGIESAHIKCACRIVDTGVTDEHCGEMNYGDKHAKFFVQPTSAGDKNTFEMTIEFKQRDASESEERLIESLDSLVVESMDDQNSDTKK